MFEKILNKNLKVRPIVHCITNFVTVNDCANIILAAGGSPTMAHHMDEVEDITEGCHSLVLNMGNVHETDSMILAGKRSNALKHPVIIDPVGVGGSRLRTDTFEKLKNNIQLSVIRGNISEINSIIGERGIVRGVDADEKDMVTENNLIETVAKVRDLSGRLGSVIAVSGAIDIVADSEKAFIIRNGKPIMTQITGTGCMSTALMGTFIGANPEKITEAAAAAVAVMGVSADIAYEKMLRYDGGTMMFRMFLIDTISRMTSEMLNGGLNIEEV